MSGSDCKGGKKEEQVTSIFTITVSHRVRQNCSSRLFFFFLSLIRLEKYQKNVLIYFFVFSVCVSCLFVCVCVCVCVCVEMSSLPRLHPRGRRPAILFTVVECIPAYLLCSLECRARSLGTYTFVTM